MTSKTPPHLKPVVAQVLAAPIAEPPTPWKCVGSSAVGGLVSVGFGRGTDLLLVTSSQGRGVFDCLTGERVARDRDTIDFEKALHLEALGIGPLVGQVVRMSGVHGGGLPILTSDGWQAERLVLEWPQETLLLVRPGSWVFGRAFGKASEFTKVFVDSEIRAWGFSPTGRSLILATSSEVTIYSR